MDETQGFLYLGHSNWTIYSLLSWFCHKYFPTSSSLYWGSHFLLPQRGENENKGFTLKCVKHRGFCTMGIQIGPFAACWADFVPEFFNHPDLYTGAPISYYPREGKMRKRESPNNWSDTEVSVPRAFKLDHLQPVELILFHNFSTFLSFILGLQFLITPERGRREAAGAENWKKGITQNWTRHKGFYT